MTMILSNLILVGIVGCNFRRFWANWRTILSRGLGADGPDCLIALCIFVVLGAVLWPLYSSRMIPQHDGKMWSGGSCWADLPIHMHIAEAFLQGRNSDVSWGALGSPVFAGERMYYPYLPDFHAAVMKRLGGELRDGFLWSGWLMAGALWVLLYSLTVRLTGSRLGGLFALALTIGAGGTGGPSWVWNRGWSAALEVDTAQNDIAMGYRIFWFAFLPHVLLPQRGANFAYPMAVGVLLLVWRASDMRLRLGDRARGSLLTHAAAAAAALPMVQAHSFIGLAIMVGVYAALDAHKWLARPALAAAWARAGAVAALVGYPQIAFFQKQVAKGAGGRFTTLGWIHAGNHYGRAGGLRGFAAFWWTSLGPAVPLYLACLCLAAADACAAGWFARRLAAARGPQALQEAMAAFGAGIPAGALDAGEGAGGGAGGGGGGGGGGGAGALGRQPAGAHSGRLGEDSGSGSDAETPRAAGGGAWSAGGGAGTAGGDAWSAGGIDAAAAAPTRRRAAAAGGGGGGGVDASGSGEGALGAARAARGGGVTTLRQHAALLGAELRAALGTARGAAEAQWRARAGAGAGGVESRPPPLSLALHTAANLPAVLSSALRRASYAGWRPGRGARLLRALYGYDGPAPRSIGTHLLAAALDDAPDALAELCEGRASLALTSLDEALAPCNALSLSGRALDALKMLIAAGAVWMVGNYVNFQVRAAW